MFWTGNIYVKYDESIKYILFIIILNELNFSKIADMSSSYCMIALML